MPRPGRSVNPWGDARESGPAPQRHVRTAAAGERATRRRLDAGRSRGTHRYARAPERLSLFLARRADPGDRATARDGEAPLEGAHPSTHASIALVARQLSL